MGGYSGLQQVTAVYRVGTVGYSGLQLVTEWLQLATAGYRVVTVGYSRLLFAVRVPTGV